MAGLIGGKSERFEGRLRVDGYRPRIIAHKDNGWAKFELENDLGETRWIVGIVPDLAPGLTYICEGRMTKHARHGDQFEAHHIELVRPDASSVEGIIDYLSASIVKGISPVLGRRVAEHFRDQTVHVLEKESHRLTEVKGVSGDRADQFHKAWMAHRGMYETLKFLRSCGVEKAAALKVQKTWGAMTEKIVTENPYQLTKISGIGFIKADEVAVALGFEDDHPLRLEAGVSYLLDNLAEQRGHTCYPHGPLVEKGSQLLNVSESAIAAAVSRLLSKSELVSLDGDSLALGNLAETERDIAKKLARLLEGEPFGGRELKVPEAPDGMKFSSSQQRALEMFSKYKVLVMTGGPGTGKTTVTRTMLDMVQNAGLNSIGLFAPTGRAADRMQEATDRPAKTVHRGLEYAPDEGFRRDENNPLEADFVAIDEWSMGDSRLTQAMLNGIRDETSLLIIGDVDQLPSVGPGAVLKDLIESGKVPVARLEEVHRQAAGSKIIQVAQDINAGRMPDLAAKPGDDMFFLKVPDPKIPGKIVSLVTDQLQGYAKKYDFDLAEGVQILTPQRTGHVGVEALNTLLQGQLNPAGPTKIEITVGDRIFRDGDRLMQLSNNYDHDIWNGDIGRVLKVGGKERALDALFKKPVSLKGEDLYDLDLAYAGTIHKSQGSEYPCVIMPMSNRQRFMLARNLVYTGLTRARKLAVMVGEPTALQWAIDKVDAMRRHTMLKEFLEQYAPDFDDVLEQHARAADSAMNM